MQSSKRWVDRTRSDLSVSALALLITVMFAGCGQDDVPTESKPVDPSAGPAANDPTTGAETTGSTKPETDNGSTKASSTPDKPKTDPANPETTARTDVPNKPKLDFQAELGRAEVFLEIGKFHESRKIIRRLQRVFPRHPSSRQLDKLSARIRELIRESADFAIAIRGLSSDDPAEVAAAGQRLRQGGETARIMLRLAFNDGKEPAYTHTIELLAEMNDDKAAELFASAIPFNKDVAQVKLLYKSLSQIVAQTQPETVQKLYADFSHDPGPINRSAAAYFAHVIRDGAKSDPATFDEMAGQPGAYRNVCNYFEQSWRSGDVDRIAWVRKYVALLNDLVAGLHAQYYLRNEKATTDVMAAATAAVEKLKVATAARLAADQKSDAAAKAAVAAKTDAAKKAAADALAAAKAAAVAQEAAKKESAEATKAADAYYETLVLERRDKQINLLDQKFPDTQPMHNHENISARWTGLLDVPATGEYTFWCHSNEYQHVKIDGKTLIEIRGAGDHVGKRSLTVGLHEIDAYFRDAANGYYMDMSWAGPEFKRELIGPKSFLSRWRPAVKEAEKKETE